MKKINYSQIKALLALTKASIKASFKNPSGLFFGFLFPLIFITVFGLVGNNGGSSATVGVLKGTKTDSPIYKALEESKTVKFITDQDDALMKQNLEKGEIDALLFIEEPEQVVLGKPAYNVQITTSSASAQGGALFTTITNGITDKLNLALANVKEPAIKLEVSEITGRKFKAIDFILPGQLGFSLLSIGVFGTAFVFMNLRQTMVLKRFFATPIRKGNIVIAEGLSRLLFATLQAVVIIVVGAVAFDFTLLNGFITLITMLVLSTLGLTVFMGFGFIISSLAKDENSVAPLANIITLPQFLLSGTFFATDNFPQWLQNISSFLPLTHLNNAMRSVAFEGASLISVANHVGVLLIWGCIVYLVSIKIFKWE